MVWLALDGGNFAALAVIGPIEYLTGHALIIPQTDDIGAGYLIGACLLPGHYLYLWGSNSVAIGSAI